MFLPCITPEHAKTSEGLVVVRTTLKFTIQTKLKLSGLNYYSRYQSLLLSEIQRRRNNGWMYKQIAEYLTTRGYRSTRGRDLSAKLVERMYKKSIKNKEREQTTHMSIENIQVFLN